MFTMDKILGMIYGALYGDALGTPFEFNKKQIVVSDVKLKIMKRFNRYQKIWRKTAIGQYSDDTEMALIILKHLVNNNMKYNATSIAIEYMNWANSGIQFMGRNTRMLFKGVKTIQGYKRRYENIFPDEESKQNAQSNGSLMRCYPFAIMGLFDNGYEKYLERDILLTNPSNKLISAEKQYIKSVICALRGGNKKSILDHYIFPSEAPDVTENKGWYAHALYCTYMSLMEFDNYNDAIKYIISLGGDTDTNACIAGALLGAYFGFDEMKKCDEFNKNLKIMLECDPMDGDFHRPLEYSPSEFKQIISALKKIIK